MCGYFGNLHECPAVLALLMDLGMPPPIPGGSYRMMSHVHSHYVHGEGIESPNPAYWYYNLQHIDGTNTLALKNDKPTPCAKGGVNKWGINARNLHYPLWNEALRSRRGFIVASELGESLGKDRHLMMSETGFIIGTIYKDWITANGELVRSFAVITRPPHDRFNKYHDKSIPLFLPLEKSVVEEWLNPTIETSELIQDLLDNPKLRVDLEVTKVKSYKHAEALGETELLKAD